MREWCTYLRISADEDQHTAGRYLESRGQEFLKDFGYENAITKADDLFEEECGLSFFDSVQ